MTIQELEETITHLSPGEKAQVLQWVAPDLSGTAPGIDHKPDVSGGEACIVRSRIPVWILVQARRLGTTEAELLQAYPSLRAEDLANAWSYARLYPEEIDAAIYENETS